jgi:hypothetical protein
MLFVGEQMEHYTGFRAILILSSCRNWQQVRFSVGVPGWIFACLQVNHGFRRSCNEIK